MFVTWVTTGETLHKLPLTKLAHFNFTFPPLKRTSLQSSPCVSAPTFSVIRCGGGNKQFAAAKCMLLRNNK